MSRSGYTDDYDNEDGQLAMWRGVVASATRGRRGQRFFRELVAALDAMPAKRLIANNLEEEGEVCALGCLARARGAVLDPDDTEDWEKLGRTFDIASQLSQEVMWANDEGGPYRRHNDPETPEQRWVRMRAWAARQIRVTPDELLPAAPAQRRTVDADAT